MFGLEHMKRIHQEAASWELLEAASPCWVLTPGSTS